MSMETQHVVQSSNFAVYLGTICIINCHVLLYVELRQQHVVTNVDLYDT